MLNIIDLTISSLKECDGFNSVVESSVIGLASGNGEALGVDALSVDVFSGPSIMQIYMYFFANLCELRLIYSVLLHVLLNSPNDKTK